MPTIQETLKYILEAIITDPSSIKITDRQEGEVLVMEIEAAPEMIGQIIGREGKIIKSIRTILSLSFPNFKYSLDVKG